MDKDLLKHISLHIYLMEFAALAELSGAGQSTLM